MTTEVSIPLAFLGGILSFVSPCVLPLVPSYISFVTGISFEELTEDSDNSKLKKVILFNLSGHGLLDLQAYDDYLAGNLVDDHYPAEKVQEAMRHLPVI